MTTTEFYELKSKESGYDNFLHWLDCSNYEKQPQQIIEWTDELVKLLNLDPVIVSVCTSKHWCSKQKDDDKCTADYNCTYKVQNER